jgi:hypothetical protein
MLSEPGHSEGRLVQVLTGQAHSTPEQGGEQAGLMVLDQDCWNVLVGDPIYEFHRRTGQRFAGSQSPIDHLAGNSPV